jgi:15-cis-phytoene synthase
VLAALCGLEREIGASLRAGVDHQLAHARLAWWREECARCVRGDPAHPLTRELRACFAADPAPLAAIAGFVDTAVWDLAGASFASRRELGAYCERRGAALIEPLARHAAARAPSGSLRALGRGLCEIELLLALAPDARAGRVRLPLDELARAGLDPAGLAYPPWPAGLVALLQRRHAGARSALAAALADLGPDCQPPLRGLLVWAALAARASERAQRHLPHAASARDYHSALDGWHAWRAARRAEAGRLRLHACGSDAPANDSS